MTVDMPRPRAPYLLKERNRHGNTRWYVRIGKGPRIQIRGVFGTPEFSRNYNAAIRGEKPTPTPASPAAPHESLQWLWDRYMQSPAWLEGLKPARGGSALTS